MFSAFALTNEAANTCYDDLRSRARERYYPCAPYTRIFGGKARQATSRLCPRNQCETRVNSGRILLKRASPRELTHGTLNAAFIALNFSRAARLNTRSTSDDDSRVNISFSFLFFNGTQRETGQEDMMCEDVVLFFAINELCMRLSAETFDPHSLK